MTYIGPEDAIHKSYLNRLLIEIIDHRELSQILVFKGGTAASMLGFLDRFSIDLDFDLIKNLDVEATRQNFRSLFDHLGLAVTKEFDQAIMFQVRYPSPAGKRNSLKISLNTLLVNANHHSVQYLPEIDRLMNCQTIETMFANKLVAVMDRYRLHHSIAGRDIYDIHHFFIRGFSYLGAVIVERIGQDPHQFFESLIDFIRSNITPSKINEDLNSLLPPQEFQSIRKVLIPETLNFLEQEKSQLRSLV